MVSVAFKIGRGQGGIAAESPLWGFGCDTNAAPGLFSMQPLGAVALLPFFRVALSGQITADMAASFLDPRGILEISAKYFHTFSGLSP